MRLIMCAIVVLFGCGVVDRERAVTAQLDDVYDPDAEDLVAVDVDVTDAEVATATALSEYEGTSGGVETSATNGCEWSTVFVYRPVPLSGSRGGDWKNVYRCTAARVACTWYPGEHFPLGAVSCTSHRGSAAPQVESLISDDVLISDEVPIDQAEFATATALEQFEGTSTGIETQAVALCKWVRSYNYQNVLVDQYFVCTANRSRCQWRPSDGYPQNGAIRCASW